MIETECNVRKWGSSLGIVIPKEVAEKIQLKAEQKVKVLIEKTGTAKVKEIFGMLKLEKPTEMLITDAERVLDIF